MTPRYAGTHDPEVRDEVLAEIDRMLAEAPIPADDIAGELAALVLEFRDCKQTERPGER